MIRKAELSGLKLPEAQHVELLAYDDNETRLCVHHVDGVPNWTIVNKNGLFLTYGNNFIRAVGDMAAITGNKEFGFAFRIWE